MGIDVDELPTWFSTPTSGRWHTAPATGTTTYLEAIRWALEDELAADDRVVLLGQDIATMGGAFRVTQGLVERFSAQRIIDTPISEAAMVGAGIGLAASGWRPVVELQFADFISCAYDQLVTEAAKAHFRFGISIPLVVRSPSGGGVGAGPFHSQCPEGVFAHIPGLKIVCPGTPQDAYDLLRAAIRDLNPVLFFEHKALYRSARASVTREGPVPALGVAAIVRPGEHLTIATYGGMLPRCLTAADRAVANGVDVEVIDLRTVHPLDAETVVASVRRTGRLVVVHEDTYTNGIGAELAALVGEAAFFDLDAPIRRVTAPDTPVPFAQPLEEGYIPSVERITEAILEVVRC